MNAREFLQDQERQALAGLRRSSERLAQDLADLSLVPAVARRHPRSTVAGAVALGLVAGFAARPLRRAVRARLGGLPLAGAARLAPLAGLARLGFDVALRRLLRP